MKTIPMRPLITMETITMIVPLSSPSVNGFLLRGRSNHDKYTTLKTISHIPTREWMPVKTRGLASVRGGRPPEGGPAIMSRPFSAAPRVPGRDSPPRWGLLPRPERGTRRAGADVGQFPGAHSPGHGPHSPGHGPSGVWPALPGCSRHIPSRARATPFRVRVPSHCGR